MLTVNIQAAKLSIAVLTALGLVIPVNLIERQDNMPDFEFISG